MGYAVVCQYRSVKCRSVFPSMALNGYLPRKLGARKLASAGFGKLFDRVGRGDSRFYSRKDMICYLVAIKKYKLFG